MKYCNLLILCSLFSCSPENRNILSEEKTDAEKCPVEGASLYLKCANGDQKAFGLGYGQHLLKQKSIWTNKEIANFCKEKPKEIYFYFRDCIFWTRVQKDSGSIVTSPWRPGNNCVRHATNLAEFEIKDLTVESQPWLAVEKDPNE